MGKLPVLPLYLFLLIGVVTITSAIPGSSYGESSIFNPNYLSNNSSGGTDSFASLLNSLTSDNHLNALSFDNVMGELASDEHLNSISFDTIFNGGSNNGNSSNSNTGTGGNKG